MVPTALNDFPLNDEQLCLLGEAVALGSLLETVAHGMAAALIDPVDPYAAATQVNGELVSNILKIVTKNAPNRPDFAGRIIAWVTWATKVLEDRNMLVHSAWLMPSPGMPGVVVGARSRRKGETQWNLKSASDMRSIRDDLAGAYRHGVDLAHRLRGLDEDGLVMGGIAQADENETA